MKRSLLLVLIMIITLFAMSAAQAKSWRQDARRVLKQYDYVCDNTEVRIDRVVRDQHIDGHVKGLPAEAYGKFKMLFYVKTDRWYVHPYRYYEGQEEGYSYANLKEDGSFQVKTVRRDLPAQEMAAILVPKSVKIKNRYFWLRTWNGLFGGVLKYSCAYTRLQGNGDFSF